MLPQFSFATFTTLSAADYDVLPLPFYRCRRHRFREFSTRRVSFLNSLYFVAEPCRIRGGYVAQLQ